MAELKTLLEELKRVSERNNGEETITPEEISVLDRIITDRDVQGAAREHFRSMGPPKMPENRLEALYLVAMARLEIVEVAEIFEKMIADSSEGEEPNFKHFRWWTGAHYLARMQKEKLIPADHATATFTPFLLYKEARREPPTKFLVETLVDELLYLHNDPASLLIVKALPDLFEIDPAYSSRIVDRLDSFFPAWRDKVPADVKRHILDIKTAKDIDEAPVTAVHETDSGTAHGERKRLIGLVAAIVGVLAVVAIAIYFISQS